MTGQGYGFMLLERDGG